MRVQGGAGLVWIVLLAATGCSRSKPPQPAGDRLPVVAKNSAALPGATDAADGPQSPSVAESQDANLTVYQDPASGVSFRYPAAWRPAAGPVLPVPTFTPVAGQPRMTQQFLPEGTYYAPTVLRGLSFSYTVQEGSDPRSCAAVPMKAAAGANHSETITQGQTRFTEATGGDAAMCTHVRSTVDSTLRGKQCLVFERDFVTGCPYVKSKTEPRPLTDQETEALRRDLDSLMQSLEIGPR